MLDDDDDDDAVYDSLMVPLFLPTKPPTRKVLSVGPLRNCQTITSRNFLKKACIYGTFW